VTEIITVGRQKKSGKGGTRKIGRAGRKPAHKRYNAEMRWLKNKEKRIKKEAKRQARLKQRSNLKAANNQMQQTG